jgi:hypothetical protein
MWIACERCRELVGGRLARFNDLHGVTGGVSLLRDEIVHTTEALFPEAFELLFNPTKWTGNSNPLLFPVLPHDRAKMSFSFDVVEAPLPFAAACVRIDCDRCSLAHRLVLVNSSFVVLASHLTAASFNTGLAPKDLAELFKALHSDPSALHRFAAPHSVPRTEIFSGIAWIIFHEFGHILGASEIQPNQINAPAASQKKIAEELNADIAAFRILHHRSIANRELWHAFPVLLCGVEIVLRVLSSLSYSVDLPYTLRETGATIAFGHPSARYRWAVIRGYAGAQFRRGLEDREKYRIRREALLANFDHTIYRMRHAIAGVPDA